MIDSIRFKNFRALRDVEIRLSKLNLIVGPNASGKTSILEGLHYLSQLGSKPAESLFRGKLAFALLRTAGVNESLGLELSGTWGEKQGRICVTSPVDGDDASLQAPQERNACVTAQWDGADVDLRTTTGHYDREEPRYAIPDQPLHRVIRSCVLLHLDPSKLGEPSFSEEITPRVEFDGANLAASLADMAIQMPDRYKALIDRLKQVVPSVKSVRFEKTRIEEETLEPVQIIKGQARAGERLDMHAQIEDEVLFRSSKIKSVAYQVLFDSISGDNILAPGVSEGTLLTLGLLAVLCGPARPRLVLVDEFERGLHPKALGTLVQQVREILKQFPDLQIAATTHSPYLVDHFKPDEVILTALRDDGSVVAARLDEHPDFDRWKDEMKPGEFWSTVGESWVADAAGAKRGG